MTIKGGTRPPEMANAFYRDRIYPRLVSALGDPRPIQEVRQRMIPLAQGKVLEIGVGPGVRVVVKRVYCSALALEPTKNKYRGCDDRNTYTRASSGNNTLLPRFPPVPATR